MLLKLAKLLLSTIWISSAIASSKMTTAGATEVSSKFPKEEWSLLFQGAESRVYRGTYNSQPAILKERFKKTYRLPELDQKLTKERIRSELKAYVKISKKCKELAQNMSKVLYSDERNIVMAEITDSKNVSQYINQNEASGELVADILHKMGLVVAQIHTCGLIHGDLTTSNFLVVQKQSGESGDDSNNTAANDNVAVIPIDFGLSSSSVSDEDRAVDLYVLERAIQSTHPKVKFDTFLESYKQQMGTDKINKRLDQVRMRGRKRLAIG